MKNKNVIILVFLIITTVSTSFYFFKTYHKSEYEKQWEAEWKEYLKYKDESHVTLRGELSLYMPAKSSHPPVGLGKLDKNQIKIEEINGPLFPCVNKIRISNFPNDLKEQLKYHGKVVEVTGIIKKIKHEDPNKNKKANKPSAQSVGDYYEVVLVMDSIKIINE